MGTSDELWVEPMLKSNLKHSGWSWVPGTDAAASCLHSIQKVDKLLGVPRINEQL